MDGYVSKPINQRRLFQILRKFIRARKQEMGGDRPEGETGMVKTALPKELPGLRIGEALERIGIPAEVFKSILLKFAENNKRKDKEMSKLVEKGDLKGLSVAGHTLKGAAANIGAVDLQEACLALEEAANEARAVDEIRVFLDKVAHALEVVMASLATLR